MKDEILYMDKVDLSEDSDVIGYEEINGRRFPRMYWRDIRNKYPDMWVHMENVESLLDERHFICTVTVICTDTYERDIFSRLLDEGFSAGCMRTTGGLMDEIW